ncbi:hypothetical protein GCM10007103_00050 [Salinimicrobium marinum]|uniref:Uncharacterized protein n=1 Tax=Salinimicrobium marinum TaxID=680283 RepID=A0A918S437_9FLAO|nr:hypothetical protein [Salinimicrobium marinum]GHA22982.1 hypothetical protein GCM10007103_00050 [Salinimicrobium marinum]
MFYILTAITISCSKDELFPYTNEELANDEFYPYLELFSEEAKKRGYDFDNYTIDFYLADIEGAAGLGGRKIIIDREHWNNGDPEFKEFLVFHELGHAALGRNHKNAKTASGECLSIMGANKNGFECYRNQYSSLWREYYLDELFESNTPIPNWYLDIQDYAIEDLDKNSIFSKRNVSFHIDSIDLDTISNLVLEVKFNTTHSGTDTVEDFISSIEFNGYNFQAFQYGDNKNIEISRSRGNRTERMYENGQYSFNENIKFTIQKNKNLFSFFVDEQFLHAMEINAFEDTDIITYIGSETNSEIVMDLEIFQYN